jgi:hypothetical protein
MQMDRNPQASNDVQRAILSKEESGAMRIHEGHSRGGKSWAQERFCALLLEAYPDAKVEEVTRDGMDIKTVRAAGEILTFIRRARGVAR